MFNNLSNTHTERSGGGGRGGGGVGRGGGGGWGWGGGRCGRWGEILAGTEIPVRMCGWAGGVCVGVGVGGCVLLGVGGVQVCCGGSACVYVCVRARAWGASVRSGGWVWGRL